VYDDRVEQERQLSFLLPSAYAVTRFVFVRHGTYDKTTPNPKTASLLERGRSEARRAGEFLRLQGISPDLIVTTRTARTTETAEIIAATLGTAIPIRTTSGGFAPGKGDLEAKLQEWTQDAPHPVKTLLLVGHHPQQDYCLRELGRQVEIPREGKGTVLVFERVPERWLLNAHHVGGA